jgi:hypothetical protein
MKNLAVITEILVNKYSLGTRHKVGVNVLYGNGGVKWVPLSQFKTELDQVPVDTWPDPVAGTSFQPSAGDALLQDLTGSGKAVIPNRGVWGKLDTY